jgi:1-acyl-sn-glycerol-3-phosphate acyltransferase
MRHQRVEPPRIQPLLLRAFGAYAECYLRRHFRAVRISGAVRVPAGKPLLVVLNHPSWWDPLIALMLARRLFPERRHFAPIDAEALQRYRFFARLGFFGIQKGTAAGAARFLRVGQTILSQPDSALWVTAQGTFADPRLRPVQLLGGTGHLLAGVSDAIVLPVALEYPFWEEKYPEALIRLGDAIAVHGAGSTSAPEWTSTLSKALEQTQDLLAADATTHNASAFEILIAGSAGVGGVYDLWRFLSTLVRGERFRRAHGSERLS